LSRGPYGGSGYENAFTQDYCLYRGIEQFESYIIDMTAIARSNTYSSTSKANPRVGFTAIPATNRQ